MGTLATPSWARGGWGPGPPSPCVGTWAQSHGLGTARLSPMGISPNGAGDGKVAGAGRSLSLPSGTFQVHTETYPPPPGQVASFQPHRPSHHRGQVGGWGTHVSREELAHLPGSPVSSKPVSSHRAAQGRVVFNAVVR